MTVAVQPAFLPPRRLMKDVSCLTAESFINVGQEFLNIFITHCGLQPHERVLDIGCGCGRMALMLANYLTTGSYEGFDVMPRLVTWCAENITPRYPNFRFQLADVYNKVYNPGGKTPAREWKFPYRDNEFDFETLSSVFTHMLPDDVENYTREIARTLKPGGRALMTFFLLNDESNKLKDTRASSISLKKSYAGGVTVMKRWKPEAAVGYPETMAREIIARNGLTIREPILFGSWCGRTGTVSFQDLVIAEKPGR